MPNVQSEDIEDIRYEIMFNTYYDEDIPRINTEDIIYDYEEFLNDTGYQYLLISQAIPDYIYPLTFPSHLNLKNVKTNKYLENVYYNQPFIILMNLLIIN